MKPPYIVITKEVLGSVSNGDDFRVYSLSSEGSNLLDLCLNAMTTEIGGNGEEIGYNIPWCFPFSDKAESVLKRAFEEKIGRAHV